MSNKSVNVDEQLANKLLTKYGYSFDMAIVMANYKKVTKQIIETALRSVLSKGNVVLKKECDVEEFIKKSYSVYLRRMGRVRRDLLVESYGELYADTLETSHKALISDKPNIIDNDKEIVFELKGGSIDHDSLSDPRYVSIHIVPISNDLTSIRVSYNSRLNKNIWSKMIDINLMLASAISFLLDCDAIFGRATSLSIRNEIVARFSRGKERGVISGKGVLNDELSSSGLSINSVLDSVDVKIGILFCTRELATTQDAIMEICKNIGSPKSYNSLIAYLTNDIIPSVTDQTKLPLFSTLYGFSREFINAEKNDNGRFDKQEIDSMAGTLAAVVSKYLMYVTFLKIDPSAKMYFYVLDRGMQTTRGDKPMGIIE